jgi:hypothetical protein
MKRKREKKETWDEYRLRDRRDIVALLTDCTIEVLANLIAEFAADCVSSVLAHPNGTDYIMTERGTLLMEIAESNFAVTDCPFEIGQSECEIGKIFRTRDNRLMYFPPASGIVWDVPDTEEADTAFVNTGSSEMCKDWIVSVRDSTIGIKRLGWKKTHSTEHPGTVVKALYTFGMLLVLTADGEVWCKDNFLYCENPWKSYQTNIVQIVLVEERPVCLTKWGTVLIGARVHRDISNVFTDGKMKLLVCKDGSLLYSDGSNVFTKV